MFKVGKRKKENRKYKGKSRGKKYKIRLKIVLFESHRTFVAWKCAM